MDPKSGLLHAHVELMRPTRALRLARGVLSRSRSCWSEIIDKFGEERFPAPVQLDDGDWVAWRLTEVLPLEMELKQPCSRPTAR